MAKQQCFEARILPHEQDVVSFSHALRSRGPLSVQRDLVAVKKEKASFRGRASSCLLANMRDSDLDTRKRITGASA
ncbi:hypothetical protein [Bordetella sp. N]|uniref:hypothetical protein n=1 Tax=Bordetella sp. N TaxID=1746199 RepID=UPI00070FC06A|nr:hypothetical protein [Bordetella sp. N]ALM83844.1 hypothetical protein ASB57_13460 [Bordetella sp. N]